MRMKRREGAKHERRNGIQAQPLAIHAPIRPRDLRSVWLLEPAAANRPREIYRMVAGSLYFGWRGNRMGDVPLLALNERHFRGRIDRNFSECYCRKSGPR